MVTIGEMAPDGALNGEFWVDSGGARTAHRAMARRHSISSTPLGHRWHRAQKLKFHGRRPNFLHKVNSRGPGPGKFGYRAVTVL